MSGPVGLVPSPLSGPGLRRHQLAWLTPAGWARAVATAARTDGLKASATDCLAWWAARQLPLVVTRQPAGDDAAGIALGLAAPIRWQRQRLALTVARNDIAGFGDFPLAADLTPSLPRPCQLAWRGACIRLAELGATAHVYGSRGWQCLTGLDYVHDHSDLDLWVTAASPTRADRIAAVLAATDLTGIRIDGELALDAGRFVAWREWQAWRTGQVAAVLIKTLTDARLQWRIEPAHEERHDVRSAPTITPQPDPRRREPEYREPEYCEPEYGGRATQFGVA